MTIKEMHIQLDLDLQKVNSNVFRNLQEQAKDMFINRAILQFIKLRTTPKNNRKGEGYEESQKRVDDLQNITVTKNLLLYEMSGIGSYTLLPANYHRKIAINITSSYDCKDIKYTTSSVNHYSCIFTLPTDASLYTGLKLELVAADGTKTEFFNIANYSYYSGGIIDAELKFELVTLILNEVNKKKNYSLYWEKYNGDYTPNNFILVVTDNAGNSLSYASVLVTGATINATYLFNSSALNQYTIQTANLPIKKSVARNQSSEYADDINALNFGKSTAESPLTKIENDFIYVYHDKTFIPQQFELIYIREPQVVNYFLNHNCDLNPDIHSEIVELAANIIRSKFTAEQQTIKQETILND